MPAWLVFGNQSSTSVAVSGAVTWGPAGFEPAVGAQAVAARHTTRTWTTALTRPDITGTFISPILLEKAVARSPAMSGPARPCAMPRERRPLHSGDDQKQGDAEQRGEHDGGEHALGQHLVGG